MTKVIFKKIMSSVEASNCLNVTKGNLTILFKGRRHFSQAHIIPNTGKSDSVI